jgi:hypothetical protein
MLLRNRFGLVWLLHEHVNRRFGRELLPERVGLRYG